VNVSLLALAAAFTPAAHAQRAPQGSLERGEALLQAGNLEGARSAFEAANLAAPRDAKPFYYLGVVAERKGDGAHAVELYRRAVALDPKLGEAWSNLAALDLSLGHAEAARDDATKATAAAADSFEAWFNLGLANDALAQPKPATVAYQRALALKPGDTDTLVNLGAAQRRAGDVPGATRTFEEAVKRAPRDPQAHYDLGLCLADAGKLDAGRDHVKRATELDPTYTLAWRRLAAIELRRGHCADARAAFDRFFKLSPKTPRKEADDALKACK
jgi:Tfp pilus assembly protein PilF